MPSPESDPAFPRPRIAASHHHHARYQSPVVLPRQSAERAERGRHRAATSDTTGGGKEPGSGLPGPGVGGRGVRFGRLSAVVVVVGGWAREINFSAEEVRGRE